MFLVVLRKALSLHLGNQVEVESSVCVMDRALSVHGHKRQQQGGGQLQNWPQDGDLADLTLCSEASSNRGKDPCCTDSPEL